MHGSQKAECPKLPSAASCNATWEQGNAESLADILE
jgi:hypothetical protein